MLTLRLLIDVIGWVSSISVLAAYFLISSSRVQGSSWRYQWLNLIGSIGLLVNTAYYGAFPSATVNFIWLGIALWSMFTMWRKSIQSKGAS